MATKFLLLGVSLTMTKHAIDSFWKYTLDNAESIAKFKQMMAEKNKKIPVMKTFRRRAYQASVPQIQHLQVTVMPDGTWTRKTTSHRANVKAGQRIVFQESSIKVRLMS